MTATVPARPVVLVLLGCFWPGNDASGPNQSFRALAAGLGDAYDFRVVALAGAPGGPPVQPPAGWVDLGIARARYLAPGRAGARGLRRLLADTPHDLLWLSSVFDRDFTWPALAFRRLGLIPRRPTLLSPRGEFGGGALGLKAGRKAAFLAAAPRIGLWRDVAFHATSEAEAADIAGRLGAGLDVRVAPNMRAPLAVTPVPAADDRLRLAFVGRITPVKNLHLALDILGRLAGPTRFDIYGPAEDAAYAARCRALSAGLPGHVEVVWHGEVDGAGVAAGLARADLLLLPTAGENFGHAIFEALSAGVPAVVSDRTPWRDLAADRAGADLPLADPAAFAAAIEAFRARPESERAGWRAGARARAARWLEESGAAGANRALIEAMIAGRGDRR